MITPLSTPSVTTSTVDRASGTPETADGRVVLVRRDTDGDAGAEGGGVGQQPTGKAVGLSVDARVSRPRAETPTPLAF
jgi:hypothetical protein